MYEIWGWGGNKNSETSTLNNKSIPATLRFDTEGPLGQSCTDPKMQPNFNT